MFQARLLRRRFEAAIRDLDEKSPRVRVSAIADLVFYAEERRAAVVRALERALKDDHAEVRSAAALALADAGGVEALPSLLYAVEDESLSVQQMAITALGELGDARARERLKRALRSDRPEIRFQALIAFGRVAPDEAEEAIALALQDGDAHVRYAAVRSAEEAAEKAGRPIGKGLLGAMVPLLADPDGTVRGGAAVALARSGDREARAVLFELLCGRVRTREIEDELAAIELAGTLELVELIPVLERRAFGWLRFLPRSFSWHSLVALAQLGSTRAKEAIACDLRSRSRARRTQAVAAVGQARLAELRGAIEAMIGREELAEQEAVERTLEVLPRVRAT